MKRYLYLALCVVSSSLFLFACSSIPNEELATTVDLADVFGTNMVIQRERPITFFGKATPNSFVAVEFNGKKQYAKSSPKGDWETVFPKMKAGGAYDLKVYGKLDTTIEMNNILIGDVWFCSGQSNMAWTVNKSKNSEEELRNANYPEIRLYNVAHTISPGHELNSAEGSGWLICNSDNVSGFSGVGYFFGRDLHVKLGVPIGLINASWGGRRIEPWISEAGYITAGRKEADAIKKSRIYDAELERKVKEAKEELAQNWVEWFERFFGTDKEKTETAKTWKEIDFNDDDWDIAKIPTGFDPKIDGVGWFRKNIDIPATWLDSNAEYIINLGAIDDCDETYFNGVKIGETGVETSYYWSVNRKYTIPQNLLKAGNNVIAIRVADHYGDGGLMGNEANMYIGKVDSKDTIPIFDNWKMKMEFIANMKEIGNRPTDPIVLRSGKYSADFPATLYNSMINAWTKYPIRGVIWYQGCANNGSLDYYPLHKILIYDWRVRWKQPDLPFILVQLAGYESGGKNLEEDYWTKLEPGNPRFSLTREIQAEMLNVDKNVGMAVAMDVGEATDIHPTDKQTVGYRLAKEAGRITYGCTEISQGPLFKSMQIEGDSVILDFENIGKGLTTNDGKDPGAFAIAGEDGKFFWAKAKIKENRVIVSSEKVKNPKHVRYAWVGYRGDTNLCNKDGFAASPFRTDKENYTPILK